MHNTQKTAKNKLILSAGLIVASAMYALSQYTGNVPASIASTATVSASHAVQSATAAQTKTKTTNGLYADGTYTGAATDAYYGTVQVKAVIQNGKLATVQFLQSPNGRSTSLAINSRAMPALTSEAIQVQSANVNVVSGATFTSQAFQQSLQSALVQAQA
jgi:uncharacterized protein with FMN-binding domain